MLVDQNCRIKFVSRCKNKTRLKNCPKKTWGTLIEMGKHSPEFSRGFKKTVRWCKRMIHEQERSAVKNKYFIKTAIKYRPLFL